MHRTSVMVSTLSSVMRHRWCGDGRCGDGARCINEAVVEMGWKGCASCTEMSDTAGWILLLQGMRRMIGSHSLVFPHECMKSSRTIDLGRRMSYRSGGGGDLHVDVEPV